MKVSVIVPAYNEERWIFKVVQEIIRAGYDVLVVDDCSKDRTVELASKAGAHVLCHVINRGQGAALRTGTNWSLKYGADIVVHFDADGQFRVEDVARVIQPITHGTADIVLGSRFLDRTTNVPLGKRFLLMPLARIINDLLFGVRLSDPQSGFRAFTASVGHQLYWRQDRMAHASELLALMVRGHWRIQEVPITVIYHEFGQGFFGGLKILKDLFLKRLG